MSTLAIHNASDGEKIATVPAYDANESNGNCLGKLPAARRLVKPSLHQERTSYRRTGFAPRPGDPNTDRGNRAWVIELA